MLALALPVLAVSFAVTVTLVERADYRRQQAELRREVERTARVNAQVLAGPIWYVNVGSLTAGLEVALQHDDVVAAVARDTDRTVLAWSVETTANGIHSGQGAGPPGVDEAAYVKAASSKRFSHRSRFASSNSAAIRSTVERFNANSCFHRSIDSCS